MRMNNAARRGNSVPAELASNPAVLIAPLSAQSRVLMLVSGTVFVRRMPEESPLEEYPLYSEDEVALDCGDIGIGMFELIPYDDLRVSSELVWLLPDDGGCDMDSPLPILALAYMPPCSIMSVLICTYIAGQPGVQGRR